MSSPSMAVCSPTLYNLPPELRLQILPYLFRSWSFSSYALTCHQFRQEVQGDGIRNVEASLTIDPTSNSATARMTLDKEGCGAARLMQLSGEHAFYSDQNRRLHQAPFDSFKSITISVLAPCLQDPAQLIRTWQNLTSLIQIISPRWRSQQPPLSTADIEPAAGCSSTTLPDMHIVFEDNPAGGTWYTEGKGWQQSVRGPVAYTDDITAPGFISDSFESDLDTVMTAFCSLRQCRAFNITLPTTLPVEDDRYLQEFADDVSRNAMCQWSFGLAKRDFDDLAEINVVHLSLDYLLDHTPGRTANTLRHERFINWCESYGNSVFNRLYGYMPRADTATSNTPVPASPPAPALANGFGAAASLLDNGAIPSQVIEQTFFSRYRGLCAYDREATSKWNDDAYDSDLDDEDSTPPRWLETRALYRYYKEHGIPRVWSREYQRLEDRQLTMFEHNPQSWEQLRTDKLKFACVACFDERDARKMKRRDHSGGNGSVS